MCSVAVEEMLSSFCAQQDSWTDILTVADKHYFIHSFQFSSCIFGFAKAIKKRKTLQNEEYLSRRPRAHCLKPDRPVMSRCSWAMIAVRGKFRKKGDKAWKLKNKKEIQLFRGSGTVQTQLSTSLDVGSESDRSQNV